jgi:hypothetical protein
VSVGDKDHGGIAMVPTMAFGRLHQALDLVLSQILRSTLEKDCLKDRGPKPAAQFGVQYLYAPDEMVRYARIWRRIWRARLCVSSAPLPPSRAKQLLDVLRIFDFDASSRRTESGL